MISESTMRANERFGISPPQRNRHLGWIVNLSGAVDAPAQAYSLGRRAKVEPLGIPRQIRGHIRTEEPGIVSFRTQSEAREYSRSRVELLCRKKDVAPGRDNGRVGMGTS